MNKQIVTKTTTTREAPRKRARNPRNRGRKAKAKRNQQNRTLVGPNDRRQTFRLSECADLYLRVLLNPFGRFSNACVPDIYDTPSAKYRTFMRGFFQTGTQGRGYVLLDVMRAAFRDLASLNTTSAAWPDAAIAGVADGIGVFAFNNTQAPFVISQLGSNEGFIQVRPVAAGIRTRYIGTELNRSGRVIPFRQPGNRNILNYDEQTMLGFAEIKTHPVDRQWKNVIWIPMNANDYQYRNIQTSFTALPGNNENTICIMIDSNAGNFFEYEAVVYYEYIGGVANVTPSHSDVSGVSAVRGFFESSYQSIQGNMYESAKNYFNSLTPADISGWVSGAARVGMKAAPLLLEL